MSKARPKFLDSPYFVPEPDNWHLKEGAPEDVKKEFEEYTASSDLVFVKSDEPFPKQG